RCCPMLLGPSLRIAAQRIVAAVIAAHAQVLEDPDQRQLLAGRLGRITFQQFVERTCPSTQLRSWLDLALVLERSLARPQHLTDRVPGHPETPCDLLDLLALNEVLTSNPCNRFHDQHSPTTRFESKRERIRPTCRGSILDADPPAQGVNIARRITRPTPGGVVNSHTPSASFRWGARGPHDPALDASHSYPRECAQD